MTDAPLREASDLRATRVVATLDQPIEERLSLVYVATFALAWRELARHLGRTIALDPPAPLAEALAAVDLPPSAFDSASVVARAGVGPSFLATLREEVERRFGRADGLPERLAPGTVLAYAILERALRFATPFERAPSPLLVEDAKVEAFGCSPATPATLARALAAQIAVHSHDGPGDFVVELATRDPGDVLVLARARQPGSLRAVVARALGSASRAPSLLARMTGRTRFGAEDTLLVPLVDLHVRRRFTEVEGHHVAGHDLVIERAEQLVRLRLDETGATVRSSAVLEVPRGRPRGRQLVFHPPFLLALARRGAPEPYAAAWVAGPELLVVRP